MNTWRHNLIGRVVQVSVAAIVLATLMNGCRGNYGDLNTTTGGTGADFLSSGRTQSFFTAIQVDPKSEDSAGPQFVIAEDLDGDGLLDLVSAWNQSQPVQIHLQRRSDSGAISFETVTLAGNIPVVSVAGLAVTDFDQDGRLDIAVLIKETLLIGAGCLGSASPDGDSLLNKGVILMYFGPDDPQQTNQALAWQDRDVKSSFLLGTKGASAPPEEHGFTSMAVGDMDLDGDMDIVVAWNPACSESPGVLLFTNDGSGSVRRGDWTVSPIADPFQCPPVVQPENCVPIKDVALGDIDRDGDLDIVVTFPQAASMNVRWYRNPTLRALDQDGVCYRHDGSWNVGTVGQVEPREGFTRIGDADIVRLADIDRDGIPDVVVRSTGGRVIQWLKGPECPTTPALPATPPVPPLTDPFRNIPWQVYSLAEFIGGRTPQAIALGDLNFDGQLELIASAEGGLAWFNSQAAPSIFDQWIENLIVDDEPPGNPGPGPAPATTDPNVEPEEFQVGTPNPTTFINSILVVDLDGDGANDLVVTLDRTGLSGLTNDALVWFRNTRRPPG